MDKIKLLFSSLLFSVSITAYSNDHNPAHNILTLGDWQGVYIGWQLGAGWNQIPYSDLNDNYFNTFGAQRLGTTFHFSMQGIVGGVNLGYRIQVHHVVFGLQGTVLGTAFNKEIQSPFPTTTETKYTSTLHYLASLTANLGLGNQLFLVHVRGGWAGAQTSLNLQDNVTSVRAYQQNFDPGWLIGGGIDFKLLSFLSIGLTGTYSSFQRSTTLPCPLCGTGVGEGTPHVKRLTKIKTVATVLNYLFQ